MMYDAADGVSRQSVSDIEFVFLIKLCCTRRAVPIFIPIQLGREKTGLLGDDKISQNVACIGRQNSCYWYCCSNRFCLNKKA